MTQANVSLRVRHPQHAASVIDIEGDITAFAENTLMEAFNEASDNGVRAIVLNFNNLSYMNSSGIGLLVTMLIRAQRQKQKLLAFGLSDHYQQIFELTRLNEAIMIFPGETEALSAL